MDEDSLAALEFGAYLETLRGCRRCEGVEPPPVVGSVEDARILLVGQAPGPKERDSGRPFTFSAGTTLFRWLASIGAEEAVFRERVHMAAAIRCFPGKNAGRQGDRKPSRAEVDNCHPYLLADLRRLKPELVLLVGRLAIEQFVPHTRLDQVVGRTFPLDHAGHRCVAVPLPHPSGLSAWHKTEPGKTMLAEALARVAEQPIWRQTFGPVVSQKEIQR